MVEIITLFAGTLELTKLVGALKPNFNRCGFQNKQGFGTKIFCYSTFNLGPRSAYLVGALDLHVRHKSSSKGLDIRRSVFLQLKSIKKYSAYVKFVSRLKGSRRSSGGRFVYVSKRSPSLSIQQTKIRKNCMTLGKSEQILETWSILL